MKKIFIYCAALTALVFSACDDEEQKVDIDAPRPTFSIIESDQETDRSAWVSCEFRYDGTEQIKGVGFAYKDDTDITNGYIDVKCAEGEWSQTSAGMTLENLKPDTKYRYYCYLMIGDTRCNSVSYTFTTAPEGSVVPELKPKFGAPASRNLTVTSADLTCSYTYRGEKEIAKAGFRYKKTADGTYDDFELQTTESPLTCTIDGLEPGTEFTFYAYLTIDGTTYQSGTATFATLPEESEKKPVFETPAATNVTATTADLSCAYVYAGKEKITEVTFRYKKTADSEFTNIKGGGIESPLTCKVTGLEPATGYTFYVEMILSDATKHSSKEATFTTKDREVVAPVFSTPSASNVTASSADVACNLTYAGDASDITEIGFEYKAASASAYTKVKLTAAPGGKSASLSGLASGSTYNFRLYTVIAGTTYQSAEASFTTKTQSGGDTGAKFSGWAELPAEKKGESDYYYAYHLTDVNAPTGKKARNYGVCYSNSMKCAIWVAAPMHPFYSEKNVKRTDAYKADPDIPVSQPGKWSGYTRGHLLGSSERLVSSTANHQVFYYSNIAPQLGQSENFNTGKGAWNNLEDWVDTQWEHTSDTTYQIIGSYWANKNKKVSGTTIPTHYYKVLLRTKGHKNKWVVDCSRDELQCIAIMVEHRAYSKSEVPQTSQYRSKGMLHSVKEIEEMTGITFFPNVPNAPKDTYNPSDWGF